MLSLLLGHHPSLPAAASEGPAAATLCSLLQSSPPAPSSSLVGGPPTRSDMLVAGGSSQDRGIPAVMTEFAHQSIIVNAAAGGVMQCSMCEALLGWRAPASAQIVAALS